MVTTRSRSAAEANNGGDPPSDEALKKKSIKIRASKPKPKPKTKKPKPSEQSPLHSPPHSPVVQSTDEGSVGSPASSSGHFHSPYQGVPLNVQKQLAQDIEQAGGIEAFANKTSQLAASNQLLCNLCNARESIFGKRGDPIRRRIINLVYTWKEFSRQGTYVQKVLHRLGVVCLTGSQSPFSPSLRTPTPKKERALIAHVAFPPARHTSESDNDTDNDDDDKSEDDANSSSDSPHWKKRIAPLPKKFGSTEKENKMVKPIPPKTGKKKFQGIVNTTQHSALSTRYSFLTVQQGLRSIFMSLRIIARLMFLQLGTFQE